MYLINHKIKKKYRKLFDEKFVVPCKLSETKQHLSFKEKRRKPKNTVLLFSSLQMILSLFFLIQFYKIKLESKNSSIEEGLVGVDNNNASNLFLIVSIILFCLCIATFLLYTKSKKKGG